jgi:hypothetical protein
MEEFTSEVTLTSCIVTKVLVDSIEQLLLNRFNALAQNDEELKLLKENISVSITDSYGTQTLNSISDFPLPRFSDDTKQISISISSPYRSSFKSFKVEVQFNTQKMFTKTRISFTGTNSRQFVTGLLDDIKRHVALNKTSHWLFHFPPTFEGMVWGLALIFPLIIVITFNPVVPESYLSLLIPLIAVIYLYGLNRIFPYTTFDSNIADKRKSKFQWILGLIVSAVIIPLILKYLFLVD